MRAKIALGALDAGTGAGTARAEPARREAMKMMDWNCMLMVGSWFVGLIVK